MNAAQLESTLSDSLRGTRLIVVANREPYIHLRRKRTARGLVELAARAERDDGDRVDAAGKRPRHRARSRDARLRRHLDRARQRQRRSRDLRRARPRDGAARSAVVHAAARVADAGRRAGLLLRLRQQRPVAALSHCLRASRIRRCGLAAVCESQPPVRGCGDRRGRRRSRRRLRAGLPLRVAAAIREGSAPRRDRVPVLAHPVAESRSVSRLPVGRGHPARAAGQRSARLSRPVSLQQFPRHRRSRPRVARRLRALRGLARRPADLRAAVSDQHRSVALERPGEGQRPRQRDQERSQDRSASRTSASFSASIASTTPRAFPIG